MFRKTLATAIALTTIVGCASNPDKMQTAYVSTIKYSSYDCNQLQMQHGQTTRRLGVLYNQLKKEANTDNWQTGVGLLVFWPALLFVEGGDGVEAAEYSQLKGDLVAIEETLINKSCR